MESDIVESLRDRMFRGRLDNRHEMLGYASGRRKQCRIRTPLGDRVRIELSPYDLDRGRIVYRLA
jgi:translation initiation factor IF-1